MRWIVTLEGNRSDVERLLAEPSSLSAGDSPCQVVLDLEDPEHNMATDDAS